MAGLVGAPLPLSGRVAVVTGAARGIGRAAAHRLALEGARVAFLDVDGEAVTAAAAAMTRGALAVSAHTVDVADELSVAEALRTVLAAEGRIDILVNNAGIYPHAPLEELTFAEWRRVLSINLDGVFLVTRAVYPHMRERNFGRIVNISTAAFHIGYPELTAYLASKGGIIGFTRSLAAEAGPYGITVNAITPGMIETEGTREEDPDGELFDEIGAGQAVKRRGRPEDIAEAIAYLARPAAGFITGQTINVDGGHRMH
jgi:NAD(P)-dependent dehydrogenase (short-subunit alcohol dehydrogenase family)